MDIIPAHTYDPHEPLLTSVTYSPTYKTFTERRRIEEVLNHVHTVVEAACHSITHSLRLSWMDLSLNAIADRELSEDDAYMPDDIEIICVRSLIEVSQLFEKVAERLRLGHNVITVTSDSVKPDDKHLIDAFEMHGEIPKDTVLLPLQSFSAGTLLVTSADDASPLKMRGHLLRIIARKFENFRREDRPYIEPRDMSALVNTSKDDWWKRLDEPPEYTPDTSDSYSWLDDIDDKEEEDY